MVGIRGRKTIRILKSFLSPRAPRSTWSYLAFKIFFSSQSLFKISNAFKAWGSWRCLIKPLFLQSELFSTLWIFTYRRPLRSILWWRHNENCTFPNSFRNLREAHRVRFICSMILNKKRYWMTGKVVFRFFTAFVAALFRYVTNFLWSLHWNENGGRNEIRC